MKKQNKTKEVKTNKKRLEGKVVSTKMTNAIVVKVESSSIHPKYGKIMKKVKKFYARTTEAHAVGDTVVIEESRPLSRLIRWIVVEKK